MFLQACIVPILEPITGRIILQDSCPYKGEQMKLQILIPQYKETDEVVKPLLDSIALQQRIDFHEIGVIICNDGSHVFLSEKLVHSYPFEVQ